LVLVASLGFSGSLRAQDASPSSAELPQAPLQSVEQSLIKGLQAGDARQLLHNAADRVEISLFGARTFYSQSQAFYVVRDFFGEHPPRRVELRDTVQTDESYFLTGRYWHTRTDQPLDVFIRMQHDSEQWTVHEIRIESVRR
jgi:hypothetical protein